MSDIFYNCMPQGIVSRDTCEKCFNSDPELKRLYVRRANCIKNNAEKEPDEF